MSGQRGIARDRAKFNSDEAADLGGIHFEKLKLGFCTGGKVLSIISCLFFFNCYK